MSATRLCAQTEHIVGQLLATIPRHGGRGNLLREEIRGVVAGCLDLVSRDGPRPATGMSRIHRAAVRWAVVGVPIETVHGMVREGFRLHMDGSAPYSPGHGEIGRLMDALHAVTATVSAAYREITPCADRAEQHAVAAALLAGRRGAKVAREYGVPIAEGYTVLAVSADPANEGSAADFRDALSRRSGQLVPALLSGFGGTLLVPGAFEPEVRELLAGTSLTVAAVGTTADRIPAAADIAHEVLDVARRLHGQPGLYRFDDLALEYQLTRPGPGRDRLTAVLDPLGAHPELLRTLRVHVRNDLNRRLTARALHIHQNTVDHRLKRIGVLVGLDSSRPTSLWWLRAALVARGYTHPDEPGPDD
ncbi:MULTISPECIES: helix-turn-helix domain-containing protein [Nocardia]|uniref:helix-turn-helix domain-containing protein n=1 Tax=Nocardia TaxID=1817 RepID=UPI000D68B421|nr:MULTISPECIES: helix-turn-helix domain-containing protein [Nocardia]